MKRIPACRKCRKYAARTLSGYCTKCVRSEVEYGDARWMLGFGIVFVVLMFAAHGELPIYDYGVQGALLFFFGTAAYLCFRGKRYDKDN